MNTIYKERLLELANFLYELPPERFDYSMWVGNDWKGKADLSCGTTACALGWATTIPNFQELGLKLISAGEMGKSSNRYFKVILEIQGTIIEDAFRAASSVFGLTDVESFYLFSPEENPPIPGLDYAPSYNATPQEVATHIRNFVKVKY